MNTYTLTDLKEVIGNYETWGKLLSDSNWNSSFSEVIEKRKVKYQTELTYLQIKKLYNEYKSFNMAKTGRPKQEKIK